MTHTAHIQTARREADEIIWQRFDDLLRPLRERQARFTEVILASCVSKNEPMSLEAVRTKHILKVVAKCGGNKKKAAKLMGCSNSTVHEHLKKAVSV